MKTNYKAAFDSKQEKPVEQPQADITESLAELDRIEEVVAEISEVKSSKMIFRVSAANGLNLRKTPEGAIIRVLAADEQVSAETDTDELSIWLNVTTAAGENGYVKSEYLDLI